MKRNLDLIRKILLKIEAEDSLYCAPKMIDGYSETEWVYHLRLLKEAGILAGDLDVGAIGDEPELSADWYLTSAGHDLLDSIREDSNWVKTKTILEKMGGWTFELLLQVGKAALVERMKKYLPGSING